MFGPPPALVDGLQSPLEVKKRQQRLEHLGTLDLGQVDRNALAVLDKKRGGLLVGLLVEVR
jgi:hypothetical protein